MSSLFNKRILLGVTGGIAAYKSAELIRRLQDAGAQVRVVMTPAAQEFITPLTLQALSGHPVHADLLDPAAEAAMGHIELARWADLVLVAPASADVIARLTQGQGDDLLTTICLATAAPIALAPAMNQGMWRNQATQDNIATLAGRGVHLFGPAEGSQACGDVGPGRMLEVQDLVAAAAGLFDTGALAGKTVVITAGPTREAIDPVRYLSNHSSGKMGYALAQAALEAGAKVILISGPVALPAPERVTLIPVTSAQEMYDAALACASSADVFIAAAAVADYRPASVAEHKLKKTAGIDTLTLTLVKNPDIVASVAALPERPCVVGFAAESELLLAHARAKREHKRLDAIVANDISTEGIGFNSDDNAVIFISDAGEEYLAQRSKSQLARDLIGLIAQHLMTTTA
ncbi:bifunctional phosphopantothenoylcysteine decarboxylase/phosphopantothenate--cysteine ligase CoaBC [Marinimicrobium alkaliphilum]|uniref:bifunctional phosphopantothenoylcysteine decarboxylase/phosphopantothenate--cysteine ligase CoaBC n=1 Tax=Marinimicrobium alkaliphilum TaxID=2202654 RepID=UPI000DBACE7E|nr:bifunctional phosphopantothenoylcysteine decarboxylase/phosphopantothenate--cysteine ligase CoaBC [Marinimicrobium alkaliphilum]